MRKGQDRKVKFAEFKLAPVGRCIGKMGCLGMLGLGVLLVNPVFSSSASALTTDELESGALTSAVSIAFAPASGNTALSPTDASGASGLISVLANVSVTNSGGYSVYLGSNSSNLVGKNNNANVIPGVSGEVSFDNLQDNTWGFYAGEGSAIPEDVTYKAVAIGQGNAIYVNNNSRVQNENKTFVLGFAAKIDNNVPADTYENQVTLSVLSSPYQLTLMDIDNMQEMTSAICENTPQLTTKQLKDVRDGKYYWVTKLADNNCWMTQNLALNIPETGFPDESVATNNMTWQNSDMSGPWIDASTYPPKATVTALDLMMDMTYEGTLSLNQNNYLLSTPLAGINCGNTEGQGLESEGCRQAGFVKIDNDLAGGGAYDEHYLLGNYYQWNAATAGTGGTIVSINNSPLTVADMVDASASICPKNWRLPVTGGVSQDYAFARDGSFGELLSAYGWTGPQTLETNALASAPIYFVRAGWLHNGTIMDAGQDANVWSSTAAPIVTGAYHLGFGTGKVISPSFYSENRGVALPVRCVAR